MASAVALAETGQFREAVQYVQKAAKALYESAKEVFERLKASLQRLVELFVETVTRMLAWIDEHKAYLFLMAAAAAGVIVLSVALNIWGLIKLEKLAYAASAPFFAELADAGGRAAERFKTLAERYEKWRVDENVINEVINAPPNGERPYLKLARSPNLPKPLVELRKALARKDEVVQDAVVVAALVLYKTLINNAGAYREWAGWYGWARRLVEKQESTMKVGEVERLREAQRRLADAVWQVRKELNSVLTLYSRSGVYKEADLKKLKSLLEVDLGMAEGLAKARSTELSEYGGVNMGTKVYAALLSIARGGIYGHIAMLLMGEGALADIVLLKPKGAYDKAGRVANARGEAVDPSYSGRRGRSVGQPSWEDRAASVLLRYLLSRAVSEDLMFRLVKGGFEVFRAYGGVEARVDVLRIWETVAHSKASEEVLRRFVEEAKRTAPDLSGVKKIWQTLEWLNTDVTFNKEWIVAGTTHLWQAAWYVGLFGEPESISGGASVTEEGVKPYVKMRWRREVLDRIIAEEGSELEPLLGRTVKSWRELVDAIDWSWVLKKVEELAGALKPWIGPKKMDDAEREELVRKMLGELALLAHIAEARRGLGDDEWREERVKRLAKAVEALSRGRIAGEYADRLAQAIIYYAEGKKTYAEKRIDELAKELVGALKEDVERVRGEVWGVVKRVLSGEDLYAYCLASDCARDEVVRKFVAPALELIMLDKALRGEFNREEALLIFGELYATAVAGDGHVGPREVGQTVGGELGGGAALLRLATLHMLSQHLPNELRFDARVYVGGGRYYDIDASGENAARFMRLLAVSAPSAGGGYLSPKFNEFVEEARVEVRVDNIRQTERRVAADLIISVSGVAVTYTVYLDKAIELRYTSTDRSRAELAALLLKHVGVDAKMVGNRNVWQVVATTDMLAAGGEELRKALAEFVNKAVEKNLVEAGRAERWLKKLESGLTLEEGWPKYSIILTDGVPVVKFGSISRDSIEREAQRLENMGLKRGYHFTVTTPEGGKVGYVYIRREGLAYAAYLSVHGNKEAARFVEFILQRAEEKGKEVYKEFLKVVNEGKAWGSLTLEGFVKEFEVDGKKYVVKVIGGGAEFDEGRSGKKLLRIKITAEVDGVVREYVITFGRYGKDNVAEGRAYARADAPGGREADAERFAAVIEALTGVKPRVYRRKNGIEIVCGREHLEGFMRYKELVEAIMRWLEETSRR